MTSERLPPSPQTDLTIVSPASYLAHLVHLLLPVVDELHTLLQAALMGMMLQVGNGKSSELTNRRHTVARL